MRNIILGKKKSILVGIIAAILVFIAFGIPTALIPSGFYSRMITVTILDYFFLLISSVLIGAYVSLWHHTRGSLSTRSGVIAYGGGASAFFAVSCPICSVILVSLIGTTSVMLFLEPLRPVFGLASIGLLSLALTLKFRDFRDCRRCGFNQPSTS